MLNLNLGYVVVFLSGLSMDKVSHLVPFDWQTWTLALEFIPNSNLDSYCTFSNQARAWIQVSLDCLIDNVTHQMNCLITT